MCVSLSGGSTSLPNFIKIGDGPGKKVSELAWNDPVVVLHRRSNGLVILVLIVVVVGGGGEVKGKRK